MWRFGHGADYPASERASGLFRQSREGVVMDALFRWDRLFLARLFVLFLFFCVLTFRLDRISVGERNRILVHESRPRLGGVDVFLFIFKQEITVKR